MSNTTLSPMLSPPLAPAGHSVEEKVYVARQQIRGSSLLFAGRVMSQCVSLGVHVLTVRYLSATSFGALAYALSVVYMCGQLSTLGMDKAVSRFLPVYHERREYDRMFGTLLLVVGTILAIGIAIPVAVLLLRGVIAEHWVQDPEVLSLIAITIFLIPLEALDTTIVNMFAVFANPRAIFFRRYLLSPVLRLSIVALLVLFQCDVWFLACGYVVSSLLGVGICGGVLYRLIEKQGLAPYCKLRSMHVPWREVLAFSLPLLSTDIFYVLMYGFDVILLEHYCGTAAVAPYRAVQPIARLNQVVFSTFTVLFAPQAARLFARHDSEGVNHLYWKTATWIAVLTFPVFIASFSLCEPLTLLLFGERYAGSGTLLALLAVGYYFNAALGFNGTTLTIYRKVWYVAALTIVAAVVNVSLNLILIPRYGALGAAIGTTSSLVLHNVLKQAGLRFGTGINVFDWRYLRVYVVIAASAAGLLAAQHFAHLPQAMSFLLAGLAFVYLIRANRDLLDVTDTFPELMRLPLIARLLGKPRRVAPADAD